MSILPTAKRRRLDDSTNVLRRPFVSPLKANDATRSSLKPVTKASTAHLPYLPSTLAHTSFPIWETQDHVLPSSKSDFTSTRSTPIRKSMVAVKHGSGKKTHPAELALQKSLTKLEMQIRALRNDLDTLNQAAALRTSDRDTGLEDLSSKWKIASQTAAEELFGTVKERVNRMGGVASWRESEKRKYNRSHGLGDFAEEPVPDDDADCEFDSQGEELPEAEQEWRKKLKRKAKEEAAEAAETLDPVTTGKDHTTTHVWQEAGADDDAFTMDMMLRSLNIELDVIGYDKLAQRWAT